MKKQHFFLLLCLAFGSINAQVGINTTTPKALFEIKSSDEAIPLNTDGLLIPKVAVFPATNPTVDQQGMLVYLKNPFGTNQPGFYYWNFGTLSWISIISSSSSGTLDQAYDFGGAGLGKTITADSGAVLIGGTDGLVSTGTAGSGSIVPSGAGTRMVWNPRKSAFRAGRVLAAEWDDVNVGGNSVAFGFNSRASGSGSTAFGFSTTASGINSTAFGFAAGASGENAIAFGNIANATGNTATAFGAGTLASGSSATAFGQSTTAIGNGSTAFGASSIASGSASTAFGAFSTASGIRSTAFGNFSTASGSMSTVFGQMNLAASYGETVIGIGATTYTPSINGSTEFRSANVTDRLFVIGNATDANNNDVVELAERRDAFVILKNGNAGIGTSTPLEKLHVIGNIRMVDGNQAAGRVLTSDANGTATWQNSSTTAWGLLGNAGTNSTTNFIGTTDNQDLVFRRNNTISGRLGVSNSSFGVNALDSNTIGLSNTANGVNSLTSNTAGSGNTAIGFSALTANISGLSNTAVGELALASNGGNGNTAVGATTLASNTIGFENTAIGYNALSSNTSGVRNTANGREALVANSTGSLNTAMGSSALLQNTFGDSNTAIGTPSLLTNTTGDFNTTLGSDSDVAIGNLVNATAIGARAEVGASNSLVLGSINGVNGATSSVNVGIGVTIPTRKLHIEENTISTTVGQLYLQQSGTGDAFMHIGNTAGRHFNLGLDTSEDKFKIGTSTTTATAVTTGTLLTIQGTGEVGIGTITPDRKFEVSGLAVQYGRISSTTASDVGLELKRVGSDWQMRNDTGEIIFAQSGDDLVTVTDVFRIGGGSVTPAVDNVVSLGQLARRWTSVFAVNGVIQTSDANDKKQMTSLTYGLDKIKQLRPISFQWKDNSIDNSSIHLGFVAQEVQQVLPEVIVDSDWIALQESSEKVWQKSERLGMKYAEIIPVIVKAIQEQQVIIEQKQEENNQLRAQLEVQNNKLIIIMQRLENLENKQ